MKNLFSFLICLLVSQSLSAGYTHEAQMRMLADSPNLSHMSMKAIYAQAEGVAADSSELVETTDEAYRSLTVGSMEIQFIANRNCKASQTLISHLNSDRVSESQEILNCENIIKEALLVGMEVEHVADLLMINRGTFIVSDLILNVVREEGESTYNVGDLIEAIDLFSEEVAREEMADIEAKLLD